MNIAFQLKNRYFPRRFIESAAKRIQTPNQKCSLAETRHFMVHINTYMIYMIYIYDIYDILLTCFLTRILFKLKLLQTALKLSLFEKYNPLSMKDRAEGLIK